MSETSPRPFEERTTLERTLRAHRHHPAEFLKGVEARIKSAVKAGDYAVAASLKKGAVKARRDLEVWDNLLALYEEQLNPPPGTRARRRAR